MYEADIGHLKFTINTSVYKVFFIIFVRTKTDKIAAFPTSLCCSHTSY